MKLTISSQCTFNFKLFIHPYSQISITRKSTYNSSVLLTGLKRKRTFTSSPAVITNLITKEKLIQLLNTATNKQTQRVKNKTTNNEVLLKQTLPLTILLSKWLKVMSQDQLEIQLSKQHLLQLNKKHPKLPRNDGFPGPKTFSSKMKNFHKNQN